MDNRPKRQRARVCPAGQQGKRISFPSKSLVLLS
jgi:hypothetical protein